MGEFRKFDLPKFTDDRFTLIELQLNKWGIDFNVRRVYAIVHAHEPTGQHCHRVEQEVFACFGGAVTAVIDEGMGLKEVVIKEGEAIYVGTYVWHHFRDFTTDAILVALSSTDYNPNREDYIQDYAEFKQIQ